jgi:hypothetical protein
MKRSRLTTALAVLIAGATALAPTAAQAATPAADPTTPVVTPAADKTWSGLDPDLPTPWTSKVSPKNALPDYPRPQLARPSADDPTWQSLNGIWQYEPSDGYSPTPLGEDLAGEILVPYPTESVLSGVKKHSDFMVYRKTVTVPKAYTNGGKHLRLNFGAVNYDSTVFVNGTEVGHHTGAYDSFSYDITSALLPRGPQEIVVAVHSPVDSENIQVGKQRLDPSGIFYTAASGIWQSVWLEPVAPTSIASFTATPNVKKSSFTFSTEINGDATNARVRVDVLDGSRRVASATGAASGDITVSVPKPHLWSPSDPFLYSFKVTLTGRGGSTDRVESYAGLRSVSLGTVDGKQRIFLNGKPTFVMATLDQGYWPDGIYTAPTDEALKFDIKKTKDLGFNAIRKHIKVEPARWYYWADKLGMLVMQDSPALPTGRNDRLTAGDKAEFRAATRTMVDQLKGVTSVIAWVPFNEGWGQWSVQAATDVAEQVKAQDPTRLVDARSGSNCCDTPGDPGSGDLIDWHQYQGPALPAPDAKRASIDGEHGGLTLTVEGHTWPGAPINPYGSVKDYAELNDKYVANTEVLRDQGAPYGLSGAVYTQITDVEGEQNGFFTYDRRVEKVDEARVRTVNREVITAGTKPAPTPPAGTPGLGGIASYSFDEGTGTTAADAVGQHPLTLKGGAAFTADGHDGSALTVDGNGQYATSEGTVVPTEGTNYSISAWVKLSAKPNGAFQTVVSEDGDVNSAFFLQYSGADDRWAFSFAQARALANTVGSPKVDQWYHLVGVRDIVSSTLTIYVDGAKAGSVSILGNGDKATGDLLVGRGKFNGGPVDYLRGSVDSVRVFDRALSAAEVEQLD